MRVLLPCLLVVPIALAFAFETPMLDELWRCTRPREDGHQGPLGSCIWAAQRNAIIRLDSMLGVQQRDAVYENVRKRAHLQAATHVTSASSLDDTKTAASAATTTTTNARARGAHLTPALAPALAAHARARGARVRSWRSHEEWRALHRAVPRAARGQGALTAARDNEHQ